MGLLLVGSESVMAVMGPFGTGLVLEQDEVPSSTCPYKHIRVVNCDA